MSSRTRCTCCFPDHAGAVDSDHTRNHVRSLTSRTIRSASRRRDVHEAGLGRMRIRARSSSNHNVCILSPYNFSFSPILYQTCPYSAMSPHRHTRDRRPSAKPTYPPVLSSRRRSASASSPCITAYSRDAPQKLRFGGEIRQRRTRRARKRPQASSRLIASIVSSLCGIAIVSTPPMGSVPLASY